MRFDINLATRPYEDVRRFYWRWGSVLAALAILTIVLAVLSVSAWRQGDQARVRVEQARGQIADLNREKQQAEIILARPGNHGIVERSRFLNGLIARKAFSWTQMFTDLEKIMPPRVHVVSITPGLTADRQLEVHLQVVGATRESAIELVRRMEQSPHFQHAEEEAETGQSASQPAGVKFDIVARYVPGTQGGQP